MNKISFLIAIFQVMLPIKAVVGIPELSPLQYTTDGYYSCFVVYNNDLDGQAFNDCKNFCRDNPTDCKVLYYSTGATSNPAWDQFCTGYCGYYKTSTFKTSCSNMGNGCSYDHYNLNIIECL